MATDEKTQIDAEKTKEIRQLLAEGGDAAVQHKFGEDVTASAEYQKAQKQREAVRKRQETMRRNAAQKGSTTPTKPAAGAATKPASRTPKAREQTLERRRLLKEQEKQKDARSL